MRDQLGVCFIADYFFLVLLIFLCKISKIGQELEGRGRVKFIKFPVLLIAFSLLMLVFDLVCCVPFTWKSMVYFPHFLKPEEIA